MTTTQKLRCAQFLISKATFIESAINTPRFSARREINFKEASESSLILIPVLLWAEELQLCHEAVLS